MLWITGGDFHLKSVRIPHVERLHEMMVDGAEAGDAGGFQPCLPVRKLGNRVGFESDVAIKAVRGPEMFRLCAVRRIEEGDVVSIGHAEEDVDIGMSLARSRLFFERKGGRNR